MSEFKRKRDINYPPPDNYIKPIINFERTDEDREAMEAFELPFRLSSNRDDAEELVKLAEQAQYATLFVGRLLEAVLRAGNDISAAHECVIACFGDEPDRIHEIALDWAEPDMSGLTGDKQPRLNVDLDPAIERGLKNARKQFIQCAIALPLINKWVNMGLDLGLNHDLVLDAGVSILDLERAFGPIACNCRYCTEEQD